jgi:hypothetical protein
LRGKSSLAPAAEAAPAPRSERFAGVSVGGAQPNEPLTMPRYFFSCEGAQTFEDLEGTELDDVHSARLQAIENAGEILRDHAESFHACPHWRMTVSDETGSPLFILYFKVEPVLAANRAETGR